MKVETTEIYFELIQLTNWLNQLESYNDELRVFSLQLSEVVRKNNNKEILAQVEHFQNQLIVQQNQLNDLKDEIKRLKSDMEFKVKSHLADISKEERFDEEKLTTYNEIYFSFKAELKRFLNKAV